MTLRQFSAVVASALCVLLAPMSEVGAQGDGSGDSSDSKKAEEEASIETADDALLEDVNKATLFPIPDHTGGFFSRSSLTGDWGGARSGLAENHGLQFEANANQYYQGVTSGGTLDNGHEEYGGTADVRMKLDTGKAGLWRGGFLEIHGESYWGDTTNIHTGAMLPVNFDPTLTAGARNGTYLSHVVFTQFLSKRFGVILGKIDTSVGDTNDYAHGTGDQRFMNSAFTLNPVTYLSTPYSVLGAGFVYLMGPERESLFTVMVYDGDGRIDETGFDTVDEGRTTIATAFRFKTNFFGRKGHQWLGLIYGDGDFSAQSSDPRLLLPEPPPDAPSEVADGTWCVFYNFDQQLHPKRDWGVFGRVGYADQDSSVIEWFLSLGLGGKGLFPSRPNDSFGLGTYYMTFNDDRLFRILPEDHEQGVELFYTVAVTPFFELTADVQVVDGALLTADDTAVVAGIRARIVF
jgi:porin